MRAQTGRVLPDVDAVVTALGATFTLLASTLQGGWAREVDGVQLFVTGAPVATLNGVLAMREDCDAAEVRAGLSDLSREVVSFFLQCRPSWREVGEVIASDSGLVGDVDIPLMAAVEPMLVPAFEGLSVRKLDPREARLHCEVASPAFGASPDLFAQIVTEELLGRSEVAAYVGEVDGEPVVTAISMITGDALGIFNVATSRAHRRRGYGAAITAQAAGDGFDRGAAYAWLQSSEAGLGVYEQLGFATLERWPCWLTTA